MKQPTGEKGYPLLFFYKNTSRRITALVTFLLIILSGAFYLWYTLHTNDAAPDSVVGYTYAILGTICFLLAAILYSLRRRSRKNRILGQLNRALHWHILLGLLGLAFLLMHTFGNLNPRSGTYALYGLIALVISGLAGRLIDRLLPRLLAHQVQQALTVQGEDRIETLTQQLRAIITHNRETLTSHPHHAPIITEAHSILSPSADAPSLPPPDGTALGQYTTRTSLDLQDLKDLQAQPLHTPWDLAYISLEATPQELSRNISQHRLIPDKHSSLTRPGALIPGAQEHISQLRTIQRALRYEQFYRSIIRYWRLLHIALALLTIGLIIWHLIYAAQLLLH